MLHQLKPTSKLDNNGRHPRKHEALQNLDESSTSGYLQRQPVRSSVHLSQHLKLQNCMGLEHTCTKYRYTQAHTMIMDSQVSGLAKMVLGKLVSLFPNLDQEIHAMRVTCIIILIILHTTHNILHIAHNILHIAHNILHIIRSYAMRPWNHGLDIRLPKMSAQHMVPQLGSLHQKTQSLLHSFICTSLHLFISQCKHQLYRGCSLRLSSGLLCNDQE